MQTMQMFPDYAISHGLETDETLGHSNLHSAPRLGEFALTSYLSAKGYNV